jgi:hypothetical protein
VLLVRVDGSPILLGEVGLDVDHDQAPRGIAPRARVSHANSSRCYWIRANADRLTGEKRAPDSRRRLSARGASGSTKHASSRESRAPTGRRSWCRKSPQWEADLSAGRCRPPSLSSGPLTRSSAFSWMQGRRHQRIPRRSGTRKFRKQVSACCAAQTCNARIARLAAADRPADIAARFAALLWLAQGFEASVCWRPRRRPRVSADAGLVRVAGRRAGWQRCGNGMPTPP